MTFNSIGRTGMRSKVRRSIKGSLLAVVFLIIGAFGFFLALDRAPVGTAATDEIISVQVIERTRQLQPPPPPHHVPIPAEAVGKVSAPEVDADRDDAQGASTPLSRRTQDQQDADDDRFYPIEEAPEIIGGMSTLRKHLVYPDFAVRAGIEGSVTVLAYVNKEGIVMRTEVLRGIGAGCDEAAMDAVRKVRFKPAEQRGKPVNVKASVQVSFRLK
ncbi:MAG: energy transducer TonB [Bacteroidia bacterium]|nr:energy transducer TonB [Bacteroidia bacterium]